MENKIRQLRKSMKISQEELAAIAHVSRQTVNAIENNRYDPELTLAFRFARALNTSIDTLFEYDPVGFVASNEAYWCEKYKCVLLQNALIQQNPGLTEIELS
ncbi:MAG: helix-turn-helix transcriptional regulator [Streptococcaceae bacterium]|jgi:putative transcriptional regulator|nr:helix-turn-helix transcriptional regulator [Streptococcaceae bacterium]